MMNVMEALQVLDDNNLPHEGLEALLNSIIRNDGFEDEDDKRCCIAMLFDREQGNNNDPSDYSIAYGNVVNAYYGEYQVLDDDEADKACAEYIEDSVWAFRPSFLSGKTGIDKSVFEAMQGKCEDSNDAVLSIIKGSCGLEDLVESAISFDGRGNFLGTYDGHENEVSVHGAKYYIYRVN